MGVSVWNLLLVLVIVLVLFGAGNLPKVMSDLGKGLKAFKSSMNEDDPQDKDNTKI